MEIVHIDKSSCQNFLQKYHYLSKQNRGFRCGYNYGLLDDDSKLIAVCIFHSVSAGETCKGAFGITNQDGIFELGRLALKDGVIIPNILSWFVSRCIKKLRAETSVRAIISYADSLYHHGYIYQALNFKYYGLTKPKKDFWVKKEDGSYKILSRGQPSLYNGEWRERSQKHRYLMVFDKNLKCLWEEQPYPKGNNTIYKGEK